MYVYSDRETVRDTYSLTVVLIHLTCVANADSAKEDLQCFVDTLLRTPEGITAFTLVACTGLYVIIRTYHTCTMYILNCTYSRHYLV